ncbi:LamG-like jellyroll fold domain-containing protein [Winogradskyella sp.]|uniref:LamG-like jellyroll fold domain-containing protein n=1 Tax=Winogradskyella sp. TaxID=1883156 RepID=UPI003F6BD0E3
MIGETLERNSSANGNFEIGRKSTDNTNKEHFDGAIDEVRVFDRALTADQIQRIVYQEIENNGGNVRGAVIPKDIVDINTSSTIPWSSLIAYYPMTGIKNSTTDDYSSNTRFIGRLSVSADQG